MKERILQKKALVFIILAFAVLIPVTYAVSKKGTFGLGAVSLATWSVDLNQSNVNNQLSIISAPNEVIASYTVNVNSVSDVSIVYSIVVNNVPSGVSLYLDNENFEQENNNKVIFSNVGTIPYNAPNKSRQHTIYFKAGTNTTYVNNNEVDVDVIAKQQI